MSEPMKPYTFLDSSMPGYEHYSDLYEGILLPDGESVWLTEPEDRTFSRDLAPLVQHCTALRAENERLRGELEQVRGDYDAAQHLANATSADWKKTKAELEQVRRERDDLECSDIETQSLKVAQRAHAVAKKLADQLTAAQAKIRELEDVLPRTWYADRPLQERVSFLVKAWQRAIEVNKTLEDERETQP